MIDPKSVTIIVPHLGYTKEEEYALDQCLLSLKETVSDIRVLIAKNGAECNHENFDVWVKEQDQGMAVNAAVSITDTKWIMVSNSDMIYPPGWWEKLTVDIEKPIDNPLVSQLKWCISPMLIEPRPGAPTFQVQMFGGAGGDFDKEGWLEFAENWPELKHEVMQIRTGFNLPFLIKRELWDTIQGYDINYRPWGSNADSDLEYKIRLAGIQPYQNTNCIVYHFSQSSGTGSPENKPYWEKNWHYFISKWGFERASSPTIWEANFEIPEPPIRKYTPIWEGKYK